MFYSITMSFFLIFIRILFCSKREAESIKNPSTEKHPKQQQVTAFCISPSLFPPTQASHVATLLVIEELFFYTLDFFSKSILIKT